jgi:hypothetical protein
MGGGSGTRTAARSTATACSSRRSRTSEPPRVQKNTSPSPSPARRRIPWVNDGRAVTSRASVSSSYRASHTGVSLGGPVPATLAAPPPRKRIPQSKKSRLIVPGPALYLSGRHMPPRNVAVRRASGAPTLREFLTALRWRSRKTDAKPPTITAKKMMMPMTAPPIAVQWCDHHRMPRRCLHAPWRGGQTVVTGILAAGSWHGSGTAPTWQPVRANRRVERGLSWSLTGGPAPPLTWSQAHHGGGTDRLPAPAVCPRAQPGRAGLVAPQAIPGQPGQTQPRPAHRPDQDPAQADAVPARPARRLPRQHRTRPHTLL